MPNMPAFTPLKNVQNQDKEIEISAGPPLWTVAEEYIFGPVKLKVEVVDPEAVWQFAAETYCKAGGTMRNDPAALLPGAPIGALIGKLGGGTADCPVAMSAGGQPAAPAGVRLFAVGTYAVIEVKKEDSGALFLTMNDTLAGFANHRGNLKIKVSLAPTS
ncbi:MAG: hypothetical protein ABSD59_07860 [Terracidiphilus sp.]